MAPLFEGVIGAFIYTAFIELHHPDGGSTETLPINDPECVPLEKYKKGSTDKSV